MSVESSPLVVVFDPVAFSIFGFSVHWYGIMYLLAFLGGFWLARRRLNNPNPLMTRVQLDDLLMYMVLGVILGGRLGYVFFYDTANLSYEFSNNGIGSGLLRIVSIHQGGMSFHGGLLGVMLSMWIFAKRKGITYFRVMDFVAPIVPLGLFTGRIGNFINGELWGKPSDVPWAMSVPCDTSEHLSRFGEYCEQGVVNGHSLTMHPNQLYEAGLEGIALFVIVWWFSCKPRPVMAVSGVFAVCYGAFRFFIEFYRQPDAHLSYLASDWLTMGMVLSAPLVVVGMILLYLSRNNKNMQNT